MQPQDSDFSPTDRLEIDYTDKPVSGWGGLVALMKFIDRIGVRKVLLRALPDERTSPNKIPVLDIIMTFLVAVLTGARRFAHVERLRSDEVIQGILGIARVPSAMTVTRYLGGFVRGQVEHLSETLWKLVAARVKLPSLGDVLDLDSTVFERYGKQEGSLKGHNPRKHGRPSHHPILAMLSSAKLVAHAWLRSGNSGTSRGAVEFLKETLARLGDLRLYALRADSGFFVNEFLLELEQRELPYAIAVRMSRLVQQGVIGIKNWERFAPGLEASEFRYEPPNSKISRRIVVIREEIKERPEAKGRKLIAVPGYTFHAVVTTLELRAVDIWMFYNSRSNCENRLKELKEDFNASGFCLDSFDGTEASFLLICFLFNLVAMFKKEVTKDESPRLGTLRTALLVVGAILGASGRTRVLRLGLREGDRERFAAVLDAAAAVEPTVAQLIFLVGKACATPWALRRRRRPTKRLSHLSRRLN